MKWPRPSFRFLHVLKSIPSHRPWCLAFHLMEGEPQKILKHTAFKEELVTLVVPCQGPGAPRSGFRNFPWLRGGFTIFFLPYLTMQGIGGGGRKWLRGSEIFCGKDSLAPVLPWEKPGVCPLLLLLATGWGSQLWRLKALDLPLIAQEAYMRERKGGKAEAVCWFLKQPEALAPPSPAKEGGTFVASAFLEKSCDFSGLGTEGYA